MPDDAVFSDCDEGEFRTFVQSISPGHASSHEDPGQYDVFTVLDVSRQLVIFDVSYFEGPDGTPRAVLDEMASIMTSADLNYAP